MTIKTIPQTKDEVDLFDGSDGATIVYSKSVFEKEGRSFDTNRPGFYDQLKRTLDVVGAAILLLVLLPLILFVALCVRLTSRGPVVFSQKRLTMNGHVFNIYKFRTMVLDAEVGGKAVLAKKNDMRVTWIGRYLRLCRLDELPQLVNVLLGDMSMIGPRPERPEIAEYLVKQYPSFNKRLKVKAGLTGLAQTTSGYAGDDESYRKKIALDVLYVRNYCFWLDLKIGLKTILVVLTGFGAR